MTRDIHIHMADKALAEGDYVKALDHLEKSSPVNPTTRKMIFQALERMKVTGAKELAAGRWTVAEGIFDVVKNFQDKLSPNQRAECELLLTELKRLREIEHSDALIHAVTQLAADKLFAEAREVAYSAMHQCEDVHVVSRLRRLLQGLPHPDGMLLYGFDSPLEIRQFCRGENGSTIEVNADPLFVRRGCSAHIHFPGTGARVVFLDVPQDWTGYAELNFWLCLKDRSEAEYILRAGDGENWFSFLGTTTTQTWSQYRIPLELFEPEGDPDWGRISKLAIVSPSPGATDIFLDEMRLKESPPLPPGASSPP